LVLCELSKGTSGQPIAKALLKSPSELGIEGGMLKMRLLEFCIDEASNLRGNVKGVLQIFMETLKLYEPKI
jgi:hypothetical protein